jgi:site-specific DNA-cytosine methylase
LVRVIEEFAPDLIFLENTPLILKGADWDTIRTALVNLGFDLRWLVWPSYAVGTPMERKRWFCLGVRQGAPRYKWTDFQSLGRPFHPYPEVEDPPRMIETATKEAKVRCALLGSGIVPPLARKAFMYLASGFQHPEPHFHTIFLKKVSNELVMAHDNPKAPSSGGFWGGMTHRIQEDKTWRKPNLKLVFHARPVGIEKQIKMKLKAKSEAAICFDTITYGTRKMWGAATKSRNASYRLMTKRGLHNLANQLAYEKRTPRNFRKKGHPNPEFYEKLMRVPINWTKDAHIPFEGAVDAAADNMMETDDEESESELN